MGRPNRLYPTGPAAIGMVNEGGGTRKTTNAVNIAVALARKGKKVAVLDADQTMQASAYIGYGLADRDPLHKTQEEIDRMERVYERLAKMPNVSDLLYGRSAMADVLLPGRTRIGPGDEDEDFAVIDNLWLVLGSRDMAHASDDLSRKPECDLMWLRRAINGLPPGRIDVLMVDFRGTYLLLEESMLAALDYVIGAVRVDTKDISTLGIMLVAMQKAQRQFEFAGGAAELRHILINGVSGNRGKFYVDLADDTLERYGLLALHSRTEQDKSGRPVPCVITESVRFAESVAAQEPIHYWDPGGQGAQEFDSAADALDLVWD